MGYKIEGEEAIVDITWQGKPAQVKMRKLTLKEIGYSLDEFLTVKGNDTTVKIGAMLLSLVPKTVIAAPWIDPSKPLSGTDTLDAKMGVGIAMQLREAAEALNEVDKIGKKAEAPGPSSG